MTRPTEDELIARFFGPIAGPDSLGLRDDAGLLTPRPGCQIVLTADALVAGVHFFADDPPGSIARKALRVNLSDLAAKAARPLGFLLTLGLPPDWTAAWLGDFAGALGDDARAHACPLIGGDTVATPGPLTLSITALGEVAAGGMLPRTGARPGDRIYVSGTIGDAALGLRARRDSGWAVVLSAADRQHLADRYLHPRPRLALRHALAHATGGMDVSDGLVGDAAKLLRASGVSGTLDLRSLPLSEAAAAVVRFDPATLDLAVTGGDDYEILATVPPTKAAAFEAEAARAGVPVTRIGEVRAGNATLSVLDASGLPRVFPRGSYAHA